MAPRKVLLLTYYFPPSAAVAVYRMLGLVRHLPQFGWQPVVVAPPNPPWEPEDPALLARVPPGTPVTRVPFAGGLWGKVVRRLAPEGHWLPRALPACAAAIREHGVEAVITSSPPGVVHLLGLQLKARHGLPWVASFRDPWITNHRDGANTFRRRAEYAVERRVMARADALVANTPLNQRGWEAAYPAHAGKMVTITNGFDPETFAAPADRPAPGARLTLLHAGELYSGRDPRPLLDALAGLPPDGPGFDLTFLGRSTENLFDLPTEIGRRGLAATARLAGQVPYADAVRRIQRTDLLVLIHSPGYRVGVPAKLYEYLGSGRPILALAEPESDIAWVLRDSGVLHRVVPTGDIGRIRQALVELDRDIRAGAAAVPDPAALARFTREHMAQRFAEVLDGCVGRAPQLAPPYLAPAVTF